MPGEQTVPVPLSHYLDGPIRNGFSPPESAEWTGVQMLGLGCLTPDGFQPRQLKNAPTGIGLGHAALLKGGDLLMSRANTRDLVGLAGRYRDVGNPCIYPDLMMRLRPAANCLPVFLEQLLRSASVRRGIMAAAQGTSESMVKISAPMVAGLRVPSFSLGNQRRIVELLDAVTEAEGAVEVASEKLRTMRTGILTDAMQSVMAVQPAPGWVRVPLKEVVPSVEYGISEALNQDSRGVPTLRMNNLRDGLPELRDLRYCPTPVRANILLRPGDVLFNRTNSIDHVGRAGIWNGELPEATFASYLVRLNPDTSRLTPEYLVEWLLHPVVRQRVKCIATIAVQQVNVNPSRLRELSIDFPEDLDEQRRLTAGLAACDRSIAQENDELSKLRTLKQGLADDLLSGRVRVDGAVA
ncbi:hypothetical protein QT196_18960 [Streptomyces sp. P9-2B-2]|uniref:restriction endonuclease subunit S n=1 Tax=Streptomyces TaxID=1883 RepID=UPI0022591742|nr:MULTISPECIES: hypothetical protein [Streptomyces]MCX4639186.1 hypothetical protein [Streptomyces platensis]WJY39189.1 hypothetical protein QT196_18960 [Streptomyces sp. P9-2B-2]